MKSKRRLTLRTGRLAARRAELAEVEQQLARTKQEAVNADAEHARWSELNARERAKANARVDELQEKLRALETQIAERQTKHDNIVAGISALGARLNLKSA
jgi:hypothetical protein